MIRFNKYSFFIMFLFFFNYCSAQEGNNKNEHYIQINDSYFYLKDSHRKDVESFLGTPSSTIFFKHGGEDFLWSDFTVCTYDDDMLRFHYNIEGYIIRITINSSYNKIIQLPDGSFERLDFETVSMLAQQTDNKNIYISRNFIEFSRSDLMSNNIQYSFWFDDELKIKWFDVYYEKPW